MQCKNDHDHDHEQEIEIPIESMIPYMLSSMSEDNGPDRKRIIFLNEAITT